MLSNVMMTLAGWKLDENKLIESHFDVMQVLGIESGVTGTVMCYTHTTDHGHQCERNAGEEKGEGETSRKEIDS